MKIPGLPSRHESAIGRATSLNIHSYEISSPAT